jgi:hypothetical protein
VDSSGDIHCRFQYSNVQISEGNDIFPDGFELIKTSLESMMQGTTIDIVSDRNGKIKSKNLILPKTVDPKSEQVISQLDVSNSSFWVTAVPVEKIGVGAKWRANDLVEVFGSKINVSTTYEIVELNQKVMTVKMNIAESFLNLPTSTKKLPFRANSFKFSGQGKYTLAFDSLLPIAGNFSINAEGKLSIKMKTSEPPTNIVIKTSLDTNFLSK